MSMPFGKDVYDAADVVNILRLLSNGINPITGRKLDKESEAHTKSGIRTLSNLAFEFTNGRNLRSKRTKTEIEQDNLDKGKPIHANMKWTPEAEQELKKHHNNQIPISSIAKMFNRTDAAIAARLHKLNLITKDELEQYLPKKDQ